MTSDKLSSQNLPSLSHVSEREWIGSYGRCAACGQLVSHYTCNPDLRESRPEAKDEDYWSACDNEACSNRYGEGFLQSTPDWEISLPEEQWVKAASRSGGVPL